MRKTIKIGGILSNYEIKGPNINKLLFERCKYLLTKPKKKKARRDFGQFILALPEKNITRQEFDILLKKNKIKKLDKDLVNEVTGRFAAKKKIGCAEMTKAYMELYPDTCLPPPKAKGKKKAKKKKKPKVANIEREVMVHDLEGKATENVPQTVLEKEQ